MAIQQPWSLHEAVILLDGYLLVLSGRKERKQAIADVSSKLRQMAVNDSIEIDDTFRNVAGITFQMASMESAFRGKTIMKPATKLFADTVNIYRSDFPKYKKLLAEAVERCSSSKLSTETFANWLAKKANPDTLTKLYLLYDDIGNYMQRNRIISEPILHITDLGTINKIQRTIEQNKLFKIKHKSDLYLCGLAMRYYAEFLKENQPANSTQVTLKLEYLHPKTEEPSVLGDSTPKHAEPATSDFIVKYLEEHGLAFIDNRGNQGCLWVLGDETLKAALSKFTPYRVVFRYKPEGSRSTKGKSAWWTKDTIIIDDHSEDVVKKKNNEATPKSSNSCLEVSTAEAKDDFERWLIDDMRLARRSAQSYSSAVNVAGQYSVRWGLSERELFFIRDREQASQICANLLANPEFKAMNENQHNRYSAALAKYLDYCYAFSQKTGISMASRPTDPNDTATQSLGHSAGNHAVETSATTTVSETPNSTSIIDPTTRERYITILSENFSDGFRPTKAIDRNRFRMYYSDMFGEELTEDDERFVRTLMKVGTLRDERIFVKDETEQKDLLEEINDTITETFMNGASCIYLDCLFARFQEQLAEMLHIYNADSLESVLFSPGKRNYFKRYNYLFGCNKEPAPNRDVIEYMKKSHLPVTYSEIENGLWYIPLDKIKYTLVTTPGIVNVASEAYLYAPNLPVSENEIQQIAELISHSLLQRNYISDVELMQLIEEHCPSVLMNTPNYPMWGLRNALAYLLRDKFSFRGAIISNKDEEISMAEVFSDFCHRSERITVDELKQFASELNTVIYWDSVYSEMVRVNQNEFVRRDQIHFDVELTDSVLDNLIQCAYTPIKTIDLFLHFPAIDVPWNNFVLESYVAHYSKKFRLLHASFMATDCCGAMVRQDSGISDYRTLIVDVLTKNTGWKNKKDALQLLVDLGYQQRRSYSDIEKVMQEAKAKMQISSSQK